MCVDQSLSPHDITEHEHNSLKGSLWCTLVENKVIFPFYSEEPTVTDDTFLAMKENTTLHYVPVGTAYHLHGAQPHFSHCIHDVLDGETSGHWIERGAPFLWPHHSPDLTPLGLPSRGFVKLQNVIESCDRNIRAADYVTNEMLAIPGKKLNIILICLLPLMVPVLRTST